MYTIIHAILGYFFLLFTVRVLSRRPGGQLTPFEFVIVFLIGGLIILATVGNDKSITNCVCAIITIGLMHRITAQIRFHFKGIAKRIDGVPLVLMNHNEWQLEAMRGMRLAEEDVMAVARTKGMRSLDEVKYAVLERVGTISIIPQDGEDEGEEEQPKTGASASRDGTTDGASSGR